MNKQIGAGLLLLLGFFLLPAQAQESGLESLRQTSKAYASIARKVSPSVVFIQVESSLKNPNRQFSSPFGNPSDPLTDEFFKRFFGDQFPGRPQNPGKGAVPQPRRRAMGQGSGFVFRVEKGLLAGKTYIMTNNHVVDNAENIRVKFQNGKEYDAKITGTDPKSDIAVIEIKNHSMSALPLGSSTRLQVGEWVVAIGNPFGLNNTLTVGVVSAKGRTSVGINDYEDFIQTDAAINPGNSGGPLMNLDGEVVGINTAIFSRSGGYMGIGFAIPIDLATAIAEQLIDKGEVVRGHLGVVIQPLTADLAQSFGIEQKGILVAQVAENSPASRAGLKQGDVITGYQGRKVLTIGDFRNRVSLTRPGSSAELSILREGKKKLLKVKIAKQQPLNTLASGPAQSTDEIGMTIQAVSEQLAEQYQIKAGVGVVVTQVKPGSVAAMAGIRPGAVILQANRRKVSTAAEFKKIVNNSRKQKRLLLLIRDQNSQRYLALSW